MISVQNVSHRINGKSILDRISLDIPKGGVVALVGPNGAGKSTLLSLIARLQPLQAGRITVDTLPIGRCDSDALARKLAILPQDLSVASRLTIRDLVCFGRYPHNKGRLSAEDQDCVDDALALFGLGDLATRRLDALSGGQRQRAFVAMAYTQDTDYLLLDEPLNNLDIAASRALMRLLRSLAEERDRTVLIVLHDINYAAAYADRIIALKGGRLVVDGTPGVIVSEAFLRDVFETDAAVFHVDNRPIVRV